jgi:hypothetical protein
MQLVALAAGAALLVAAGAAAEKGEKTPPGPPQLVVLGPFGLGDLYQAGKGKKGLSDMFLTGPGPAEADVVKTLNQNQVFVIDQKVLDKTGKWVFGESKEDYPRLAVAGKLTHEIKDQKGNEFTIQILEVRRVGMHTNKVRTPEARSIGCTFRLHVQGKGHWVTETGTYHVSVIDGFAYEVDGTPLRRPADVSEPAAK